MKSLDRQLQEKVAVLRARGKGEAVDAILTECSEYTLEAQLHKLDEFSRSLNPATVRKHNGASDNANHQESFNESASNNGEVGRDALIEAAMRNFPELCPTKEAAAMFASDNPVADAELDTLTKAVLGGD